ncbi:DUF429 domain-containing protein [Halobacillus litoralis]|uniref:DUF429 domain-containing protein n=1 Tax=Halobacillus litoralis TaxID=45668 RepID=UPI001CD6D61F|nr:DUF429 domain-containing protein [Halobacillus litoralis]MCA0971188.1 DUF429 domain-containing protein [Halobacillus litoralis]
MYFIGIDLSGPSNHKDTVVTSLIEQKQSLSWDDSVVGASDADLLSFISERAEIGRVVVAMDSPLSYQDGGGDRSYDRALRRYAKDLGMKSGSIMPPTLTRMIYLTARGIHLAHALSKIDNVSVLEVHPGAALASRVPQEHFGHALHYKKEADSLAWVRGWLAQTFIDGDIPEMSSSHEVDAVLAAITGWHWGSESSPSPLWTMDAAPPHHPFPISI